MNKRALFPVIVISAILLLAISISSAQGPAPNVAVGHVSGIALAPSVLDHAIGYQGQIEFNGSPVNDYCDFEFSLWDAAVGVSQIGSDQIRTNIDVQDGLFMVDALDFGSGGFNGDQRWLEIAVRCPTGSGGYTTLIPRTPLRAAPYAIYSGNSDKLDGVDASSLLSTSGGTLYGDIQFSAGAQFHTWEVGSDGIGFPEPEAGWFHIKDLNDTGQPYRLLIHDETGDVAIPNRLGIGIGADPPAQQLHVDGVAQFDLGGGSVSMSTPEGQPGIIAFASNGHRREIKFTNSLLQLLANNSSATTPNTSGINIEGGGNVGIGTINPDAQLHVDGESQFDGATQFNGATEINVGGGSIAFTTPGGWPGVIAYASNGHRREITFKDDRLNILVSDSGAASPNDNGINIYESGTVGVKVLQITGGSDLAEPFDINESRKVEPGMVVVIDVEHPGQLRLSDRAYDPKVAGCVSGANGVKPGLTMQQEGTEADGSVPVALTGRVFCWADATYGAIEPGDLLTTSNTSGHAMRVQSYDNAQGAIIGKAMTSLKDGRGLVLILVSLQ